MKHSYTLLSYANNMVLGLYAAADAGTGTGGQRSANELSSSPPTSMTSTATPISPAGSSSSPAQKRNSLGASDSTEDTAPDEVSAHESEPALFVLPDIEEDEEYYDDDDDDSEDDGTCMSSASRMSSPFIQFNPSISAAPAAEPAVDADDPDEIDYSLLGMQNIEAENKPELIACVNTVNALADVQDEDEDLLGEGDDLVSQVAQPPQISPHKLHWKRNSKKDKPNNDRGVLQEGSNNVTPTPTTNSSGGSSNNNNNNFLRPSNRQTPSPSPNVVSLPRRGAPKGPSSRSSSQASNDSAGKNSSTSSRPNMLRKISVANILKSNNHSSSNATDNSVSVTSDTSNSLNSGKRKKGGFLKNLINNHVQADFAFEDDGHVRGGSTSGSIRSGSVRSGTIEDGKFNDNDTLDSGGIGIPDHDLSGQVPRSHPSMPHGGNQASYNRRPPPVAGRPGFPPRQQQQLQQQQPQGYPPQQHQQGYPPQQPPPHQAQPYRQPSMQPGMQPGMPPPQQQHLHQQFQRQMQIQPRGPLPRHHQSHYQPQQQPQVAAVKKKKSGVGKFASRLIMRNHVQTDFTGDSSKRRSPKKKPQGPPLEINVDNSGSFEAELDQLAPEPEMDDYGPDQGEAYEEPEIYEYPPEYSTPQPPSTRQPMPPQQQQQPRAQAAAVAYAQPQSTHYDAAYPAASGQAIGYAPDQYAPQYASPPPPQNQYPQTHYAQATTNQHAPPRQGQYMSVAPPQQGQYVGQYVPREAVEAPPPPQAYQHQAQIYAQPPVYPQGQAQQPRQLPRPPAIPQQQASYGIPQQNDSSYEQYIQQQQTLMAYEQQQRHESMVQRQQVYKQQLPPTGRPGSGGRASAEPARRTPPGQQQQQQQRRRGLSYDYSTEYTASNDMRQTNYDEYDYNNTDYTPRPAPRQH